MHDHNTSRSMTVVGTWQQKVHYSSRSRTAIRAYSTRSMIGMSMTAVGA